MHDKLLYPVFKLIHKPDGWAVVLELWLHAISIAGGQEQKKKKERNRGAKNGQLVASSSKSHKTRSSGTQLWLHGTAAKGLAAVTIRQTVLEIFVIYDKKEATRTHSPLL